MAIPLASLTQFADAESLLGEYHEAIGVPMRDTPEHIAAYLQGEASAMWIAYENGSPAGCVTLRPLPSIASASECIRLYVRPSFRAKGIASALLDALEAHALRVGSHWVYLDSRADLQDALRLYASRGYEACERYNDYPQPTHFFRKNLEGSETSRS